MRLTDTYQLSGGSSPARPRKHDHPRSPLGTLLTRLDAGVPVEIGNQPLITGAPVRAIRGRRVATVLWAEVLTMHTGPIHEKMVVDADAAVGGGIETLSLLVAARSALPIDNREAWLTLAVGGIRRPPDARGALRARN